MPSAYEHQPYPRGNTHGVNKVIQYNGGFRTIILTLPCFVLLNCSCPPAPSRKCTLLKIEGRTKSLYCVARTAQVYRRAIDDAAAGRPFDIRLLGELQGLANRGYTDGFYQRHHTQEYQNYMSGVSEAHRSHYAGDVQSICDGWADIEVKNRFSVGDRLEVIHPSGNQVVTLERMQSVDGTSINVAPGSGHRVRIPLDARYDKALLARLL